MLTLCRFRTADIRRTIVRFLFHSAVGGGTLPTLCWRGLSVANLHRNKHCSSPALPMTQKFLVLGETT